MEQRVVDGGGARLWLWRSRWAAFGAAVAVTLGAGGLVAVNAASSAESTTVMIDPVRILDTRDPVNVGLAGPFVSPVGQKLKVTGSVATTKGSATVVPSGATGVLLNVTAVNATANGFVSVRPGSASGKPATSSLNVVAGVTVPNAVTVALPKSGAQAGRIDITWDANGVVGPTTDILIDVVGYTTSSTLDALRTETVTFTGLGLAGTGSFALALTNGCGHNGGGPTSYLPLPVPEGARILNVSLVVYDSSSSAAWTADLLRYVPQSNGDGQTALASASGGEEVAKTVRKDLTPTAPEVLDAEERLVVRFGDGDAAGASNALCAAKVTYQRNGAAAALTSGSALVDGGQVSVCEESTYCDVE